MKTLECLVIQFLKSIIYPLLERFQFAYRKSVDDAVSLGLFYALQHLDSPDTCARVLLLIIVLLLIQLSPQNCLTECRCSTIHVSIVLLNRPQVVKIGGNLSSSLTLSTGTPQGCVMHRCYTFILHMIVYLVMKVPKY